ncbi:MAG TPA: cysteine hydrolase family protein [Candidatus Bathyarchaeia archaeon]|nr:cysteine hydrolase family protein [Candidatus Bathyarchaeia archaeon]
MSIGLLVIDIQNDYFPGGKMALQGSDAAAQAAGRLLGFFRQRGLPIVHVQHLSLRPGATFFVPGTPGADIHAAVKPVDGEPIIQKHFPNSFRETELSARLQELGIRQLVIAGMMTHMCVDATTRAAADQGYECRIVQDACATRDLKLDNRVVAAPDVHAAFLAALNGAYGRVLTAQAVTAELQAERRP